MQINKKYFYEKHGKIKSGILLKETKAFYIFGKHLLRMMKRAVTLEELYHLGKYVSFKRIDGAEVEENGKRITMVAEEFSEYLHKKIYEGGFRYRILYTTLETEADIIEALDGGKSVKIYIGKWFTKEE